MTANSNVPIHYGYTHPVNPFLQRRQNNSRLDELSSKVSALRGVTVNIYDNARDQGVIDSSVRYNCFHAPRTATNPSLAFCFANAANNGLTVRTVGGLFLNGYLDQRLSRPTGQDGAAGE